MSEATGRCGCATERSRWTWAAVEWVREYGQSGVYDPSCGKPCWCSGCGHQLLSDGRTLPPATEEERRDAEAMALLAQNASWILFWSHMKGRWVVVDNAIGWAYGEYIADGETPTDAILAAHPQD